MTGPQLTNSQLQVPSRRGHHLRPVPLPLGSARLGGLVRQSADHLAELDLDQRLVDRLGCLVDPVILLGGFERFQDFEQGRRHLFMRPTRE